jgi:DNA-binding Lrp family transcriptional regulator
MAAAIELDAIDWAILEQLQKDATIPNKQLAEQVGVAPSTCLLRVRRLRERGVITGIHAHVSSTAFRRREAPSSCHR